MTALAWVGDMEILYCEVTDFNAAQVLLRQLEMYEPDPTQGGLVLNSNNVKVRLNPDTDNDYIIAPPNPGNPNPDNVLDDPDWQALVGTLQNEGQTYPGIRALNTSLGTDDFEITFTTEMDDVTKWFRPELGMSGDENGAVPDGTWRWRNGVTVLWKGPNKVYSKAPTGDPPSGEILNANIWINLYIRHPLLALGWKKLVKQTVFQPSAESSKFSDYGNEIQIYS